jgi:hypothetical protein
MQNNHSNSMERYSNPQNRNTTYFGSVQSQHRGQVTRTTTQIVETPPQLENSLSSLATPMSKLASEMTAMRELLAGSTPRTKQHPAIAEQNQQIASGSFNQTPQRRQDRNQPHDHQGLDETRANYEFISMDPM